MTITLPELRVGDPLCHEALSVFPLFTETNGSVEYRLCAEALDDKSIVVEEVSEGGSVPDLLVDNQGDVRVLFIEGEELIGAKQNRILNTSLLIAAHTKTKIRFPVLSRAAGATVVVDLDQAAAIRRPSCAGH